MSNVLNIAVNGLNNATARIANAASSIVNASSTPPAGKNNTSSNGGLDGAVVGLKVDQVSYAANAAVIKIAQKDEQALLDIKT